MYVVSHVLTIKQPNKIKCRATTFIVIFFGSNIVKHLGWRIGALATPGTEEPCDTKPTYAQRSDG